MQKFNERTTQAMTDGRRGGTVIALRKTSTGELFTLGKGRHRWSLGTDEGCDLRIHGDPYVSGTHCLLERCDDGALFARDQGSRNGTFVDGNHVEAAEVRVGSYMTIGRTTLVAVSNISSGGDRQQQAIELLRGRDPSFRLTIDQGLRAAQTDCSVLIVGETGTGKDLLARLVHESSRRSSGPFVAVNCGAIPRELIASELFGHEKGAFTGALEARDGYFVEANGGTLFLDEIGELPLELQPTLLRVLETRKVRRVGGQADRIVDVRIVAATNRIDGIGTEASRLRLDLYHRLATMILVLPALRDRMGDIVELVDTMLHELRDDFGAKEVTEEAWQALASYSWPGNVRELRHAIARAVALGGTTLGPTDFFPEMNMPRRAGVTQRLEFMDPLVPYQAMIKTAMEQALQTHGTIRGAALSLGMPKSTFADRAKDWGLLTKRRPRLPKKKR